VRAEMSVHGSPALGEGLSIGIET